jgi:hypothetical protein
MCNKGFTFETLLYVLKLFKNLASIGWVFIFFGLMFINGHFSNPKGENLKQGMNPTKRNYGSYSN